MRRTIFGLLCLCFPLFLTAQSKTRALVLLKKYNPDGYQILNTYLNAPTKFKIGLMETSSSKTDFGNYIMGADETSILASLGTVVHEINHGYTSLLALNEKASKKLTKLSDKRASFFFINANQQILVPHTTTFPSKLIASNVKLGFRNFRYDEYITSTNTILGTQQSGAYGLMDEWNAYFQDTKTNYELYEYFVAETKRTPADWARYLGQVNGVFYAHAEFKYFILKYLKYAQKNQPSIYQAIIKNAAFKASFQAIDKGYTDLIEQYFERRTAILNNLTDQGLRVSMDDKFTFIGTKGHGNFMREYNELLGAIKDVEFAGVLKDLQE